MHKKNFEILDEVASYYSDKLAEYGSTPRGVDWNGEASQMVRFEQLCKIIDPHAPSFSISDLGSGYGALFEVLKQQYPLCSYLGIDVSADMTKAAQERNISAPNARFITGSQPDVINDYGVASGIFNVRLKQTDAEWHDYLLDTLDTLDRNSCRGFAFNCLTAYSDEEKKRDYLYYANPCQLFDICKRKYSRQVALLHDYDLYEFTILVRKTS